MNAESIVKKQARQALLLVLSILLADQILKIWIKTHFALGDEQVIFPNWFILHFTENNGMAFGMELAGNWGKILLSSFRLVAIGGIGYYLIKIIREGAHPGFIRCVALVFTGALGNLIDSLFYGLLFSESYSGVASFMPEGGGYAPLFFGKVVDMLYFPILEGVFPSWMPFWAGEDFIFFRPVFNIADTSISTGMIAFLVFQKRYFPEKKPVVNKKKETESSSPDEK